jgi:zinc transport system substrate-binding protein
MKKILFLLLLVVGDVIFAQTHVCVSILPIKYLVNRIADHQVSIAVLAGQGQDPETYEPSPKQILALQKAKIYFQIGAPFETSLLKRLREINPTMQVVDLRSNIKLRTLSNLHDPHVWNSLINAKQIALVIKDTFVKFDPSHASLYQNNYATLIADLNTADQKIRRLTKQHKNNYFLVMHPSWGYFADDYQLRQIAIEDEGKPFGPKALTEVVNLAKQHKLKTVFSQKYFNQKDAIIIARALDGKVIAIDALAEDYINNLLAVARQVVEGLRK